MKETPIPFSSEMVKAILEGRKTQTRRAIKLQPPEMILNSTMLAKDAASSSGYSFISDEYGEIPLKCPYGQAADRLWVRETWGIYSGGKDGDLIPGTIPGSSLVYRATDDMGGLKGWKSPRFMPRWASRITLEILNVRVERLQEISPNKHSITNLRAEGLPKHAFGIDYTTALERYCLLEDFKELWNSFYTKKPEYRWEANPWVWVLEFKKSK